MSGFGPSGRDSFQQRIAHAMRLMGCDLLRWHSPRATVRRGGAEGERFEVDMSLLAAQSGASIGEMDAVDIALTLSGLLGLPLSADATSEFERVQPYLRPRLVTRASLGGRRRQMCRRDAFGELVSGISIGPGAGASFVTTQQLDAWGLEFDAAMHQAVGNLRIAMGPESVFDTEGAPGVLAVVPEQEQGSSAYFVLDHLFPEVTPERGMVFSVPGDDVLLLMPVEPGAGAAGLAGLVQMTCSMAAERTEPLCDQVFWRVAGRVVRLPLTIIDEGGSRRAHLEASGDVQELLRVLGALG